MFIVGGFNAYPAEIEGFLLEHPAVAPGRGDRRARRADGPGGQGLRASLHPRRAKWRRRNDAHRVTEADLIAWSRDRMAGYKVPPVRRVSG